MIFKPKQLDSKATKVFNETKVGTILEDIDGKLDLILEGQQGIRDDLKIMKNDHQRLDNRVQRTEVRLDAIESR